MPRGDYTAPIDWAKCGTEANYKRHRRLGEDACRACKDANTRATRARQQRREATP